MERIRKAITQAKKDRQKVSTAIERSIGPAGIEIGARVEAPDAPRQLGERRRIPAPGRRDRTILNRDHLHEMRIFAHESSDRRSAPYDMVRTRVLQVFNKASLKSVAITSPTPSAGKTVTSINLAFAIARQSDQSVLLVDLDLRKPQIARYLGFRPVCGIDDVLVKRRAAKDAIMTPNLDNLKLSVLASPQPVQQPTELITSPAMKDLTSKFQADKAYSVIIYDMPPMLSSDDFLAFLPQVDCAMLVAAAGETSVPGIAECDRLIGDEKFLGCILNKAADYEVELGYYA